jgi:hypothetical protein
MPDRGAYVLLEGMADLMRVTKNYKHDVYIGLRKELREIAKPVEKAAEGKTIETFSNIGDKWWNMRIGVSRNLVYIAPMQRSRYTRANPYRYARPQFATTLDQSVMTPIQRQVLGPTTRAVEAMLARAGNRWATRA